MVLTDVVMPSMSGPELVALLERADKDLPFIFMSGYSDDLAGKRDLVAKGYEFLDKPFTTERLVDLVRGALR